MNLGVIFTMLSLPSHEHGMLLHLFRSSLISFITVLCFLASKSCACFIRFTPKIFLLDELLCMASWFQFFLLQHSLLTYRHIPFLPSRVCSMQKFLGQGSKLIQQQWPEPLWWQHWILNLLHHRRTPLHIHCVFC